jgi:hypothetical protein
VRLARRRLDTLARGAFQQAEHVVMAEVAGGGEDDVPGHVCALVVRGESPPRDRGDHTRAADDRPAERMVAEHGLGE